MRLLSFMRGFMRGRPRVHPRRAHGGAGFTLVELMAATVVLSLILLMLVQVANCVTAATTLSMKQADAARQGSAVLDTLRDDLVNLVRQNGTGTVFAKADGANSRLAFVTRRRGPQGTDNPRFVAVGYYLDGSELKRTLATVPWLESDMMGQTFQTATASFSGILARGVLRFEVALVLDDGTVTPLSAAGVWSKGSWGGAAVPQGFAALQLSGASADAAQPRVRALSVAVAVLDEKSLALPRILEMGGVLGSASSGKTPIEVWNAAIQRGKLVDYPRPAVAALRVLQQTIPLP